MRIEFMITTCWSGDERRRKSQFFFVWNAVLLLLVVSPHTCWLAVYCCWVAAFFSLFRDLLWFFSFIHIHAVCGYIELYRNWKKYFIQNSQHIQSLHFNNNRREQARESIFHAYSGTSISTLIGPLRKSHLTSFPCMFRQRFHLLPKLGRQYSTTNASVNSCPWPRPKRPCVLIDVTACNDSKSSCRYSLRLRETMCLGHHAPPLLSIRNLETERENDLCEFESFNKYLKIIFYCSSMRPEHDLWNFTVSWSSFVTHIVSR